jgi:hypothetical protein
MIPTTRQAGGVVAAVSLAASLLFGSCSGDGENKTTARNNVTGKCGATTVNYHPYEGEGPGLAQLPWIAASPPSIGLVGHLFYYDSKNPWKRRRLSTLRMYSRGESPDGRLSMKILWDLRGGESPPVLEVLATRTGGPGLALQQLPATSSDASQFPSIIDLPAPGCWRLTLRVGATTGHVVVYVVPGRQA